MKSFNQLLISRIQSYFKKRYELELSNEAAEEYLNSLAGMIAVLTERRGAPSADPLQGTDEGDPNDLLTHSLNKN